MSDAPSKRCTLCGEIKPATVQHFYRYKSGTLWARCKTCCNAASRQWAIDHPERAREIQRDYRARDPENSKAIKARYRSKSSSKQKEQEYRRLYAQTRGHIQREATRRWSEHHRDYRRQAEATRRARKRNLKATFTEQDWIKCLEYWHHCCAYCGRPVGFWHTLAQDHFIAETKGGTYTPDNILPACHGERGCNNSKHNRDAEEWLIAKLGKRKARAKLAEIAAYFDWVREQTRP